MLVAGKVTELFYDGTKIHAEKWKQACLLSWFHMSRAEIMLVVILFHESGYRSPKIKIFPYLETLVRQTRPETGGLVVENSPSPEKEADFWHLVVAKSSSSWLQNVPLIGCLPSKAFFDMDDRLLPSRVLEFCVTEASDEVPK